MIELSWMTALAVFVLSMIAAGGWHIGKWFSSAIIGALSRSK